MSIILSNTQNIILDVLQPGQPMTAGQISKALEPLGVFAGTASVTASIRAIPYPFRPWTSAKWNYIFSKNIWRYTG